MPREPTKGMNVQKWTTVFVDGLHIKMAKEWLHDTFSEYGKVRDVYIASKVRKTNKDGFGFVRYERKEEALKAIDGLNGIMVKGKKMAVSMAKYDRFGHEYTETTNRRTEYAAKPKKNYNPSWRDGRSYRDVVYGEKSNKVENGKPMGRLQNRDNGQRIIQQQRTNLNRSEQVQTTIATVAVTAVPNKKMVDNLNKGVVVKLGDKMTLKEEKQVMADSDVYVTGMSSLNHSLLVLFFENGEDLEKAVTESSPLWTFFDDVRRWSDEEDYTHRLAWLECHGLHPKCWSFENYKAIGEKWGKVVHIDHEKEGMVCLTFARILVQTNMQQRIDECIKVEWEGGVCEVWVKEVDCYKVHKENKWNHGTMFDDSDDSDECEEEVGDVEQAKEKNKNIVGKQIIGQDGVNRNPVHIIETPVVLEDIHVVENLNHVEYGRKYVNIEDDNLLTVPNVQVDEQHEVEGIQQVMHDSGDSKVILEEEECNEVSSIRDTAANASKKWEPIVDLSIDEMLVGHYTCPNQGDPTWFDPMATIESFLPSCQDSSYLEVNNARRKKDTTTMKSRGRPRRMGNSLPIPLSVLSTPTDSSMEARETWRLAMDIGVTTPKDDAMVTEIRKSKRIQKLGKATELDSMSKLYAFVVFIYVDYPKYEFAILEY